MSTAVSASTYWWGKRVCGELERKLLIENFDVSYNRLGAPVSMMLVEDQRELGSLYARFDPQLAEEITGFEAATVLPDKVYLLVGRLGAYEQTLQPDVSC